ncbi:bifunctional diguanylate cyclase/phosphodiesterase [Pokkaliibacter sp. MBI-7]|uniref:putative bifunctional diguanylate cyclase/phosphodiesterase n=1 Tax=Pokkaliibacter sp. MBI-7 TaxID=3040600 RepID=UPI00244CF218|nr:bifunctional diguanylate cyclase/phosphodiesterase [Pokkaliibacter sp. MBI-7]MDH2433297.1 bifunctional diguanylate cyclase/phosphodiesterase [Pokkaliibacter sp. MBI-7]
MSNESQQTVNRPLRLLLVHPNPRAQALFQILVARAETAYELSWCCDIDSARTALAMDWVDVLLLHNPLREERSVDLLKLTNTDGSAVPVVVLGRLLRSSGGRELIHKMGAADYLSILQLSLDAFEKAIHTARERHQQRTILHQISHHDIVTGAANRQMFVQRLQHALQMADAHQKRVVLLQLNLDGFQKVNDSLGHQLGDDILRETVQRLLLTLPSAEHLGRISDNQFGIMLADLNNREQVMPTLYQLQRLFNQPYLLPSGQISLGCSIGVSFFPDTAHNLDELLRQAGIAMHEAKRHPGVSHHMFEPGQDSKTSEAFSLEADFRRALRRNELRLYYQPRVDVRTEETVAAEGLIRWQHPTRGLLMPNEFIPMAERTGLIVPMGYWVIHQACQDANFLRHHRLPQIQLSINLSFRQFSDPMLTRTITRIFQTTQADPRNIEFELTESAMMKNEQQTTQCIKELTELGACFALDDFGTGYSSFAHLQRLPLTRLKIDKSFVKEATSCGDNEIIVRAMISLAHNLRMLVVAEGVETPEQLLFLRQYRCDQAQGFLFGRPQCFEDLCRMLEGQQYRHLSIG